MPGKNSGSKKIVERQRSVQAKVRKADERAGKSGAKKGAVLGGVGGLVYDLATRNKDHR